MKFFSNEKFVVKAIQKEIISVLNQKDKIILGLSGGRSIIPILKELKGLNIDWSKIHILLVDERWVDLDSTDSNSALIKNNFVGFLPGVNFYPFEPSLGIKKYNQILRDLGGSFDIAILGVGEDGHIASLFPHHSALESSKEGYIIVEDAPKSPPKRISVSPKLLLKSQMAVLLFIGEQKEQAFKQLKNHSKVIGSCPAKLLTNIHNLAILSKF